MTAADLSAEAAAPGAPARGERPGGDTELLILPRYDRRGASSRLRMLQYVPYLQDAGFEIEVSPFFDRDYLDGVYQGRKLTSRTGRYYARRLRGLRGRRPGIVWLEKELYPWLPWRIEQRSLPDAPLVADYDDAVFHRYDRHRLGAIRSLLGDKIDRVMAHSEIVFAGNPYLARRAEAAGARRVEIVPTVLDVTAYQPVDPRPPGTLPAIGWIGIPLNWAEHVGPLEPLFAAIVQEHGAVFRAIGATPSAQRRPGFEYIPWDEANEVAAIQALDIGVMPLRDTEFARGKCGYKLLQYMACGLPVVASPVGVNSDIVDHGRNGFLARTEAEWREAILRLLGDPDLRASMGREGRRKVVEEYSIQRHGPRVAGFFAELAVAARGRLR